MLKKITNLFLTLALTIGLIHSEQAFSQDKGNTEESVLLKQSVSTFRALGNKDAPRVDEWFSLTCSHCAVFYKKTFPLIKKNYIDTGRIYYVMHDYPMDNLGLVAAAVANKLPDNSYFDTIGALLETQENWAFGATKSDIYGKLKTTFLLAGVPAEQFDKIVHDKPYLEAIANQTKEAMDKYGINSTPSFKFPNGKIISGEMSYEVFVKHFNSK